MAITLQDNPPDYSSVQDNLIFTVAEVAHTADPVTYPNYKFIGDVYIADALVARIKKVPDPVTKIGIFNVGQIVRNYITAIFNPVANSVLAQEMGDGEFSLDVIMKFGEEYSYTMFTDLLEDDERTFFNNYNSKGHFTSLFDLADKIVSDRPLITPVRCDSSFNFITYFAASSDPFDIIIKTYGSALLQTITIPVTPVFQNHNFIFNLSKDAINANTPGAINSGVQYYTVEVDPGTVYRFNRDCECMYEVFTLHFLNKYGGFESKDFAKVSRKTISIEKKDFGKLPYSVDSSGVYSYKNANNVYNESRSVYSSQFKEKMTLNSDFLTDAEYRWLEQLVLSPMVYIEVDGSFFPIVITETNYEPKKVINDELTNLTISIEFGETMNAQFR